MTFDSLWECDACGMWMPCCVTRDSRAGEGSFCHRCRGVSDGECDECHELNSSGQENKEEE